MSLFDVLYLALRQIFYLLMLVGRDSSCTCVLFWLTDPTDPKAVMELGLVELYICSVPIQCRRYTRLPSLTTSVHLGIWVNREWYNFNIVRGQERSQTRPEESWIYISRTFPSQNILNHQQSQTAAILTTINTLQHHTMSGNLSTNNRAVWIYIIPLRYLN